MPHKMTVGTRRQVWNGTAEKTAYGKKGLKKSDLVKIKGRIKSRRARAAALKRYRAGKTKIIPLSKSELDRIRPRKKKKAT